MSEQQHTKGQRRRAEALALARVTIIEDGLERFTMRALANALGMTIGNLQYYFPSRDDLLEDVLRAEADADLSALEKAIAESSDDPHAQLTAVVSSLTGRWYGLNGSVYLSIAVRALHDDRFAAVIREIWERFYDELARLVQRVDPTVGSTAARVRAMMVLALIDGSAIQSYATKGRLSRRKMAAEFSRTASRIASAG